MAGLQYNFFPTDFLYPKEPKPNNLDTSDATRSLVRVRRVHKRGMISGSAYLEQHKKAMAHSLHHENKLRNPSIDIHGKRYAMYLSPYPVSWVLWIDLEDTSASK